MATKKKSTRKISLDVNNSLTEFYSSLDKETKEQLDRTLRDNEIEFRVNDVGMLVIKTNYEKFKQLNEGISYLKSLKRSIVLDDVNKILQGDFNFAEEIDYDWSKIELRHYKSSHNTVVVPKTQNQKIFIEQILNKKVILGMGSPGTGKSFIALAVALKLLELGRLKKIIISKPPIESGPSIGFLPGSTDEKISAFSASFMGILTELIGTEKRDKLIKDGTIQIENIGFLRGLSIGTRDSVLFLVDEAQNVEFAQHKMILTRLGSHKESRIVYAGDQKQSDLRYNKDTLSKIYGIIKESPFVGSTIFQKSDVVRSEVTKDLLGRIEDYEEKETMLKQKGRTNA